MGTLLRADNLHKSYGAHCVLGGISLFLQRGDRLGLVGANGTGKSTLLQLLAGEPPDDGVVEHPPGTRVGLLPQELPPLEGAVWDAALAGAAEVLALRAEWAALLEAVGRTPTDSGLLTRSGAVQDALERAGGFDLEVRARRILAGLGLSEDLWNHPVAHLSGGERTRLNLARTLLGGPDVLLLDEPTNHLEVEAIEWLESFLASFRGAAVIASHDRRFLNTLVTRIMALEDGLAREYAGNFDAYHLARTRELTAQVEAYNRYTDEIERLRAFVRRQMAQAAKVQAGPKRGRDHYGRVARKMAKRAQSARARLTRLEAEAPMTPRRPDRVRLSVQRGEDVGPALAHLRGVRRQFGDRILFSDVNLTLLRGDRVGLVGPNGSGKTTLLRLLVGEDAPTAGEVWRGPGARLAALWQHPGVLEDSRRVIDVALDAGLHLPEARALLAALLFPGDKVFQRVGDLSGGERTRLALLGLLSTGTNLLLLDEPTNHLDLPSRERLEEALEAYGGTLVIASHDRFLLDRLCTVIWAIDDGTVRAYEGNFTAFRRIVSGALLSRSAGHGSAVAPWIRGTSVPAPPSPAPPGSRGRRR